MSKKQNLLKQPNSLTSALYNLNRNQKRIFYTLIQGVMANTLNKVEDGYELQIKHSDYAGLFDSDNASREIGAALREFSDNKNGSNNIVFLLPDENVGDDLGLSTKHIVTGIMHLPKSRKSSITINHSIFNMLKDTDSKYTMFLLSNAGRLQSPYAMRLYETICQWRSTKSTLKHECDWIRERFFMPNSYNIASNFRNKFLVPAVKEINEKTDLIITYEELCEGARKNSVSHILFKWKEKNNKSKPIKNEVFEPTLEAAIQTYCDLKNNVRLPTSHELNNLKVRAGELMMQDAGYEFTIEFTAKVKKAESANNSELVA